VLHRNAVCALALFCLSGSVFALEVGLESQILFSASDNITGDNRGDEIEGQLGNFQFGVFGEQKGTRINGGFAGELYSTRRLDDPDADFSAITQFLGAAELQITPRSFSWYVGDILGSVREDEGLQSIDFTDDERRNIFITGPQFVYELDGFSRVNANFFYVNQTQDDVTLESLFNTNASWSVDTDSGNTWGAVFNNIFTDNPDSNPEGDFNRFSLAGTWSRSRARNTYSLRLGGTRYDTADQAENGASARLALERQLSAVSVIGVALTRDLSDQSLDIVEDLIGSGTGVQSDSEGLFDETRLDITYDFTSAETALDLYAGIGQSDFRLLADPAGFVSTDASLEDRTIYSAGAGLSRDMTSRIRINSNLSFTKQDFNDRNRPDNTQSVLGEVQLVYQIARSFEAQLGYRVNVAEGQQTRTIVNDDGNLVDRLEDIDTIENRAIIGLRWAPPSRASKDLTIRLKSLLQ